MRWAGPLPDGTDPTGGRHAFDAEAALTPIFTTLRRTRPQQRGGRRPVAPAERFRDDPLTAPIPVVPALYAVGPSYPAAEPSVGRSFVPEPAAPPSQLETTTWWPAPATPGPRSADPVRPHGPADRDTSGTSGWRHEASSGHGWGAGIRTVHDRGEPEWDGHGDGGSWGAADEHDRAGYDRDARGWAPGDQGGYGSGGHGSGAYGSGAYGRGGYGWVTHAQDVYEQGGYEQGAHGWGGHDPSAYDPVTDTGRHHRRLAPAGW
jgi:hypothetical protein